MFQDRAPELRAQLPPRLAAALERLAAKARRKRGRRAGAYYERAKAIVSRAVGWDSSDPSRGRIYMTAMAFFVEIAGL